MEKDLRHVGSDIGGRRPDLTQPSRIALRGNPIKSGGEDVLRMIIQKGYDQD